MARTRTEPDEISTDSLNSALKNTVGSFLGVSFFGLALHPTRLSPVRAGMVAASLYALLPALQIAVDRGISPLILLSFWGVFYFGIVVTITRATSLAIADISELLILPALSPGSAQTAADYLRTRFSRPETVAKSLVAAAVCMAASCYLLWPFRGIGLVIWGAGYSILYFSAAQATLTAPFYACFSYALKYHGDTIFPFDPAASAPIYACSVLARRVLSYWTLVFFLVMSMAALPGVASKYLSIDLQGLQGYISSVIFVAGFFSFGFGSLVYLKFESDLRIAVDRVRLATLSRLQHAYLTILGWEPAPSPEIAAELERLDKNRERLTAVGYFRSSFQNLATGFLSILPPVVAMIVAYLKYKNP